MTMNISDNENLLLSSYSKFVVPGILLVIGIILGNTVVLIAAWRNRGLRKQGRCHIASLAVADLLVGLILLPIRVYEFVYLPRFPVNLCIFYIWLDILCSTVSIISLIVISIDRCYKISHPFHYKAKVTTRRCISIFGVAWLYSAIFATLGIIPYNNRTKIISTWEGCLHPNDIFYLVLFTVDYALPSIILVSSYIPIFIVAYRRRREWSKQNEAVSAGERYMFLKDLKNAKTLAIVVVTFMVCWGPFLVSLTFAKYYPELHDVSSNLVVYILTMVLPPYGNSFCNPIIYAFYDKEYRRTLKTTLKKIFRK